MPQSLVTMRVHLIFSTKNRQPAIGKDVEPELHAYLGGILRASDSPAICVGGAADHVHILFSLSKRRALMDVVEEVKKGSSKWMKTNGPRYQAFYWQRGYAAFSIGKSQEAALIRYIQTQRDHHMRESYEDELRAFFGKYGVEFDERYVWD